MKGFRILNKQRQLLDWEILECQDRNPFSIEFITIEPTGD